MNRDQFAALSSVGEPKPTIAVWEIEGPDRTLLYGYDVDRSTFHVYLKDGEIHRLLQIGHNGRIRHSSSTAHLAVDLVPDKRAYPAKTDYLFAKLCAERGVPITFTTFEDIPENKIRQFWGPIV